MPDSNYAMEKIQGQGDRKHGEGNGCYCIWVVRGGPSNKVTLKHKGKRERANYADNREK